MNGPGRVVRQCAVHVNEQKRLWVMGTGSFQLKGLGVYIQACKSNASSARSFVLTTCRTLAKTNM